MASDVGRGGRPEAGRGGARGGMESRAGSERELGRSLDLTSSLCASFPRRISNHDCLLRLTEAYQLRRDLSADVVNRPLPHHEPPSKSRGGGRGEVFSGLGVASQCRGAGTGDGEGVCSRSVLWKALNKPWAPSWAQGEQEGGVRAERAHSGAIGRGFGGADGKGFDNIVHDSLFSKIGFLCPSCLWNRMERASIL